jgi:methylmalonyl-CoA mutase cobalamin-binding domain/chain
MSSKIRISKLYKTLGNRINENIEELTIHIFDRIFQKLPSLKKKYTNDQKHKSYQDIKYHLDYLVQAIRYSKPTLFNEYIRWVKSVLLSRNISLESLIVTFEMIREVLNENFPKESDLINSYLDNAIATIQTPDETDFSYIQESNPLKDLALTYLEYVLAGKKYEANDLILKAVSDGIEIKEIYLNVFQPVQQEIGRLWEENKISVAQEHYCTAVTQLIISRLYNNIFATQRIGKTLIATCIGGELHELGIRMVADFFEMEGWETYYLGANTPIESIIKSIIHNKADLLAVSATMMIHIPIVEDMIQQIKKTNAKDVKILVGGYPFNIVSDLWKYIGADGFSPDADTAVKTANKMLESSG